MKLKSSRPTGGDLGDIINIIYELRLNNSNITFDDVINAFNYLYDSNYSNVVDYFIVKVKDAFEISIDEI